MIEAVEYVVRQDSQKGWSVWMIELDASHRVARFVNSAFCSNHRSLAGAERKAADLRKRDELHIDKVRAANAA